MLRPRALTLSLASAALATSLVLVASPVLAVTSLRITTPVEGSTVSGDLYVAGSIAGDGQHELTLALSRQTLGECGPALAQTTTSVNAADGFEALVDTTIVPDGRYCIIAVADRGRLSDVQSDITISNDILRGGRQLPTLSQPEPTDGPGAIEAAMPASVGPLLAAVAFSLAGLFALGVVIYGISSNRRSMRP